MATPVIMPKFGMAQEEATIVHWFKEEGEQVVAGELLLEVTTDKVNMEVEAPASGILRGIQHGENETVPVTQVIAYLVPSGEAWVQPSVGEETAAISQPATTVKASPLAHRLAAEHAIDLAQVPGTGPGGQVSRSDVERYLAAQAAPPSAKVRATPAARRLAREQQVNLPTLTGTGPRGRIQEADVRRAVSQASPARRAGTVVPLQGMRAAIARRMQQSYQTAPHIHLTLSADVTAAETVRERWSGYSEEKVSLTALIVKVCAWALRRHPAVNATLDGEGIHLWDDVNIGVAVALPEGLIVPVLHQADGMPLAEMARRLQDLAERARQGTLRPDDVEGGTFTITNLGMFGIESFDPILNPPQAAILGVGAAVLMPVAWQGEIALRPKMQLTLAADHRILDGAVAAQFLQSVRAAIEEPSLLLV
ncbi:MAG: 2-oxo acid dehydrogenase subunit E2 [Anaerolineae bacterium]|nr:2-oxo acid dehydrogenase subunit E2 [Anaerolineae bacterium]